ncbi:MAG: hypothetical protein ACON3Z_11485 [Bradymonadia bacterium]
MRPLRDIARSVYDQLASASIAEALAQTEHGLIHRVSDVQTLHRPVIGAAKRHKSIPWLAYSFQPFDGLIEPFQIYPGRYWVFQQMHKQASGLPELITHISKEFPGASQALRPHLYIGFSRSENIETKLTIDDGDPLAIGFYHSGRLEKNDRSLLPKEQCLQGAELGLGMASIEDNIPGLLKTDDDCQLYLGHLTFYNQGRTPNRGQLCNFLLNNAAVAVVLRYVRDAISKAEVSVIDSNE